MSENKQYMCPFFPDLPCPQGKDHAESCQLRMHADFDPVADFRDQQIMECAIYQSRREKDGYSTSENQ